MAEYHVEKILNESSFLSSPVGTEYFALRLNIYNNMFDKTIPLIISQIPSQNLRTEVYLRIEQVVNNAMNFDQSLKDEIEEKLWLSYNLICENSQNSLDQNSSADNKLLNMKLYGIHSKGGLWEKTDLVSMHTMVENRDAGDETIYTSMNFAGEWIGDGCYEICLEGKVITDIIHYQ